MRQREAGHPTQRVPFVGLNSAKEESMKRRILLIALIAATGGVIANMRKEDLFGAKPKPVPAAVESIATDGGPSQEAPTADVDPTGPLPDSRAAELGGPPWDAANSTDATPPVPAAEEAAHERILEALSESPLGQTLAPDSLDDEPSPSVPQSPSAEKTPSESALSESEPSEVGPGVDANREATNAQTADPNVTDRATADEESGKVDYDGVDVHLKDARRKSEK